MVAGEFSNLQNEDAPQTELPRIALVGAGPGDPELLTLKAVDRLTRAEVVVHDALAVQGLLERFAPNAEHVNAGKHRGRAMMTQPEINDLLVALGQAGKRVVRLKGGDPCVFGRAQEECQALRDAGIEFEIIPGISSLTAVPAAAGVIVTDRDEGRSLGAFSMHKRDGQLPADDEWARMATGADTLVLFMGRSVLSQACAKLIEFGRAATTPVALVINGTRHDQRVVFGTLSTLPEAASSVTETGPGLIVLGEVVRKAPGFASEG